MREIDNNLNNVSFKNVQPVPTVEEQPAPVKEPSQEAEKVEINDLKNMPAASLGKSQVATADTIENDLKFMEKHPELVQKFNDAIDKYAAEHTEEETLKFIEQIQQEFVKK